MCLILFSREKNRLFSDILFVSLSFLEPDISSVF